MSTRICLCSAVSCAGVGLGRVPRQVCTEPRLQLRPCLDQVLSPNFWICRQFFLDLLTIFFGFVDNIFWIFCTEPPPRLQLRLPRPGFITKCLLPLLLNLILQVSQCASPEVLTALTQNLHCHIVTKRLFSGHPNWFLGPKMAQHWPIVNCG